MVIRGARQVGKTSVVRAFAKANGLVLCEINLEKHLHLDEVFRTCDLRIINLEIEAITGVRPDKEGHIYAVEELSRLCEGLPSVRGAPGKGVDLSL